MAHFLIENECEDEEEERLFSSLIALSAKTAAGILIAVTLFVAVFCICAPYQAMKFTYDARLYRHSLAFAENAAKTEKGTKRTEALLYGIELSDKLLKDSNYSSKKYAQKLLFFTETYAADPSFDANNKAIDEFNQKQFDLTNTLSVLGYLGVYSFEEYVCRSNFLARTILNKTDEFLVGKKYISAEELRDKLNSNELDEKLNEKELAIVYNQINAYLEITKTGDLLQTDLYPAIKTSLEVFAADAENIVFAQTKSQLLSQLFLVKSAYFLCLSFKDSGMEINGGNLASILNQGINLLKLPNE